MEMPAVKRIAPLCAALCLSACDRSTPPPPSPRQGANYRADRRTPTQAARAGNQASGT
jgi:hypothetical protein